MSVCNQNGRMFEPQVHGSFRWQTTTRCRPARCHLQPTETSCGAVPLQVLKSRFPVPLCAMQWAPVAIGMSLQLHSSMKCHRKAERPTQNKAEIKVRFGWSPDQSGTAIRKATFRLQRLLLIFDQYPLFSASRWQTIQTCLMLHTGKSVVKLQLNFIARQVLFLGLQITSPSECTRSERLTIYAEFKRFPLETGIASSHTKTTVKSMFIPL